MAGIRMGRSLYQGMGTPIEAALLQHARPRRRAFPVAPATTRWLAFQFLPRRVAPARGTLELTWLTLGKDPTALPHRVEQFTAL